MLKLPHSLSCITITIWKTMCAVVHRHHGTHEHMGHWTLLAVQHSSGRTFPKENVDLFG